VVGGPNLDIIGPEQALRHGLPLFDGVSLAEGYEVGIGFWDVPHDLGIVNVVATSVHDILVFLELFHCDDVAQEKKRKSESHIHHIYQGPCVDTQHLKNQFLLQKLKKQKMKAPSMTDFTNKVKDFLHALNTDKVRYGDDAFDEYVENMFPLANDHEIEMLENYTGPPLESLDEAAAQGDGETCQKLHAASRSIFFKDGSLDVLKRTFDIPEEGECFEQMITIGWTTTETGQPEWTVVAH
jgi:hypothetical protein